MSNIAAAATALIARLESETITYSMADELSETKVLIDALVAEGYITNPDRTFIEWQGVMEFGHIPVCNNLNDEWITIEPTGEVTKW